MNTHELWQSTLGDLELKLSKAHFTTWFRNTFIISAGSDSVVIGVPNTFTKAWLEKKHHKDIINSLEKITGNPIRNISYRVETKQSEPQNISLSSTPRQTAPAPTSTTESSEEDYGFVTDYSPTETNQSSTLNEQYTFSNFIVGKQNELAHAAAQAVVSQLGGAYNPLFIYGGVGLGKTHLVHAVGNEVKKSNPNAKILYATCEQFTNDFIQSVRSGKAKDFKDRYRNVDLLLIDDIQFITGKEGTQEEFFHTFNALHQSSKQIIITSDRPPKVIPALEKRLLSRLEWGMLVDIAAPDLETRIAILEIKCQKRGVEIPREILHHIADSISSNVRELEGALNKIIAFHQFKNIQPTLESCEQLLGGMVIKSPKKALSANSIIKTVADHFDLETADLIGKSREKRIALPRQIAMYLMRQEMKISYPAIGDEVGGRDHTTAMHAFTKIEKLKENDSETDEHLKHLKERLYS